MNKRKILLGSLLLTALLVISSSLFGQFGVSGSTPVFASSGPGSNPIHFPLGNQPLGRSVSTLASYLHIFDGTILTGCDLYIPGDTYIPDLSVLSKCGYGSWNDSISSFTLGTGLWVQFYKDPNYGGAPLEFFGPAGAYTMPSGWDNTISSLKVGFIVAPGMNPEQ